MTCAMVTFHLSTGSQLAGTAAKYFCGHRDLLLVEFRTDDLGTELVWEPSRDGELFPHLYAELQPQKALNVRPLTLDDNGGAGNPRRTRLMQNSIFKMAQPMLMALPPEDAHEMALRALELGLHPTDERGAGALHQNVLGLDFANPVGVAGAGFDKDARVPDALLALGCGFSEIGTVTPRPQPGNPTPRVFRLVKERAVINRLGFNNGGHEAAPAPA